VEKILNEEILNNFTTKLVYSTNYIPYFDSNTFSDILYNYALEIQDLRKVLYKNSGKTKLIYGALPFYWHQEDPKGNWFSYIPTILPDDKIYRNEIVCRYSILFNLLSTKLKIFSFSKFSCQFLSKIPIIIEIRILRDNDGIKDLVLENIYTNTDTQTKICEPKKLKINYSRSSVDGELKKKLDNLVDGFQIFRIDNDVIQPNEYPVFFELGKNLLMNSNNIEEEFEFYLNKSVKNNEEKIESIVNFFKINENLVNSEYGTIEDIAEGLFKFISSYIIIFDKIEQILFLPSKVFTTKTKEQINEHSFGGLVLGNEGFLEDSSLVLLWTYLNNKFREWAVWDWAEKQKNDLIKHSTRSAVAAIMGRNMSHNIGSHVLSNLKDEIIKIGEHLFEVGKDDSKIIQALLELFNKKDNDPISLQYKSFFGLSWFLNYLQERQDYIATISGFENQTFIPVNFKSFILDGFLPDHRYNRHSKDNTDVKNYKNYLLEYITKSENISRNNIKTYFRDFETSNNPSGESKNTFELVKLLNISLPGGILGRQAIFSIFENFIRNSAKHSKSISELKIIIDTSDLYYDDKSKLLKLKHRNDTKPIDDYDPNELIKVTLTDNVKSYKIAKGNLENAIIDMLINKETGMLKPNYKGIKEMSISAAWLRGISIYEIDDFEKHKPPILSVGPSDEGSIQYTFYLLKPKELLIVLSEKSFSQLGLDDNFKSQLLDFGIEILSVNELTGKSSLRHSLFVVEEGLELNDKVKSKFNRRIISASNKFIEETLRELNSKIDQDTIKTFLSKYWEIRLKEIDPRNANARIFIQDDHFNERDETEYFKEYITSRNDSNDSIKILYRKHNDTKDHFEKFKDAPENKAIYKNLLFLEGISGGNSTDLYLRKLPKNELLYFKLLESCLTKVLIIDERIWGFTTGCDILDLFKKSDEEIRKILQKYESEQDTLTWAEKVLNDLEVQFNEETKISFSNIKNYTDDDLILEIKNRGFSKKAIDKSIYYELYSKKRIEILNIRFTENYNKCEFYNINTEKPEPLLTLVKDNIKNPPINTLEEFHIISIHQGIIDKIQEKMNISINEIFNTLETIFPDPTIRVIHSGRGKPSSIIPKGFYFLPYASLENAFNDCKHSLTEILYNVKEELE